MGKLLPDAYHLEAIPEVGELDELQTSVKKTHKIWLWTAVEYFRLGILGLVLGNHSSETFEPLWHKVSAWKCYFYVTDGWSVYSMFIPDRDRIISKTYMTLIRRKKYEVETFRKQDYSARLFVILACEEMLRHSIKLLIHYLKFQDILVPPLFIP